MIAKSDLNNVRVLRWDNFVKKFLLLSNEIPEFKITLLILEIIKLSNSRMKLLRNQNIISRAIFTLISHSSEFFNFIYRFYG